MIPIIRSQLILIPIHPILTYTASYVFGIISATAVGGPPALTCALLMTLAMLARFPAHRFTIIILGISFAGGHFRLQTIKSHYIKNAEILYQKPISGYATVEENEIQRHKRFKQILTLRITSITHNQTPLKLNARVRIYLNKPIPVDISDHISIRGLLCKKPKNANYEQYLFKEGITTALFMQQIRYRLIKRPPISFARWCFHLRERVAISLSGRMARPTYTLFCSLFLGKKPPSVESYDIVRTHCSAWGIVHYLARSGLHVVLIIYAWTLFMRLIPFDFIFKQIFLLFFILVFHVLTWPSISFLRALITFLLYKICTIQSRDYQPVYILSLTTLIVLIHNPLQLFFLDFQLSFGLTFALAWFNETKLRINRFHI